MLAANRQLANGAFPLFVPGETRVATMQLTYSNCSQGRTSSCFISINVLFISEENSGSDVK